MELTQLQITMANFLVAFGLVFALFQLASAETGCPEPDDISPCICTNAPHTYLECKNINNAETLRKVFLNSTRYTYNEVHIEYSSLQFLPHDMFETVQVNQLYLKNVTLAGLFDAPPNALEELRVLHMEHTTLLRGIIWELLKPLKGLRILNIYYNVIKTLGEEFKENAPKDLEHLRFYSTETKEYKSGVLSEFTKLRLVACDHCKLTHLKRDIFPVPSNIEYLYFSENKIATVPDDMFTQMPKLQTVSLRDNQIATVPESAFEGLASRITYLWLDGNPLKCDCLLLWLIRNKPTDLRGKCASPKRLQDRDIKDLSPGDFNC